jgi:anti-sigma regulatory factor (Ser/Thr protein kinase)
LNQLRLPPESPSAAAARRFVVAELAAEPPDVRDAAALLASELVTNAVLHANTDFEVSVTRSPRTLRVEVSDESDRPPVLRNYGLEAATGRGLRLVDRLASSWGVERRGFGKSVWFELEAGTDPQGRSEPGLATSLHSASQLIDPESGEYSAQELVPFAVLGLPLVVLSRTSEHYDGLFREFRLIADREKERATSSVPVRLIQLIDDLGSRFSGFTGTQEEQLRQATAEGRETVDLEYRLPADAVPELSRLDGLLDEADAYCAAGRDLLTLSPTGEAVAFRKWMLDEFVRQGSGAAPIAWEDSVWSRRARVSGHESTP